MKLEPAIYSLALAAIVSLATALLVRSAAVARRTAVLAEPVHELRGALTAISLGTSMVERHSRSDPELRSALEALEGPIARAESAIAELDGRSQRPRQERGQAFNLRALLHGTASAWSALASAYGGSFELEWRAGEAFVRGEPRLVARALDNLIANALEHGGGRVLVEARRRHGNVVVTVSDGGPGPGVAVERARLRILLRRRPRHGIQIAYSSLTPLGGRVRSGHGRQGPGVAMEIPLVTGCRDPMLPAAERAEAALRERRNGSVPSAGSANVHAA